MPEDEVDETVDELNWGSIKQVQACLSDVDIWIHSIAGDELKDPMDLSDEEWACLKARFPSSKSPGRPRAHSLRDIFDAIILRLAVLVS